MKDPDTLEYVTQIRAFFERDSKQWPPYLIRTRFERLLFGLFRSIALQTLGEAPSGMTRIHLARLLEAHNTLEGHAALSILSSVVRLCEKFTYLCDSSNWSNDGQDPRVEMCREDAGRLCDLAERLTGDWAISLNSADRL